MSGFLYAFHSSDIVSESSRSWS